MNHSTATVIALLSFIVFGSVQIAALQNESLFFTPSVRTIEPLRVIGISETSEKLIGTGTDLSFGFQKLLIPTSTKIQLLELQVDGEKQNLMYDSYPNEDGTQTVWLWNKFTPLSLWLSNGTHTLSFRAETNETIYEQTVRVRIDAELPVIERVNDSIRVTDNDRLEGSTLYLFDRKGIEEPMQLTRVNGGNSSLTIPVSESDILVKDGRWFRVVSASDKAGNTAYFSPDDTRPFRVLMNEYLSRMPEEATPATELAGPSVPGKMSPTYYTYYSNNSVELIGDVFKQSDKKNNIEGMFTSGAQQVKESQTIFTDPTITTDSQSDFKAITQDAIDDWGLSIKEYNLPNGVGVDTPTKTIVLDLTNPNHSGKIGPKIWSIKNQDRTKTPIVVVDTAIFPANYPDPTAKSQVAIYNHDIGFILVNYLNLVDYTDEFGYKFNKNLGKGAAAHELGHAFGLGHDSSIHHLMYPVFQGGLKLDFEQQSVISGHSYSEGLVPKEFGIYFAPNDLSMENEYTCSNRLLERGKPDSSDVKTVEDAEDTWSRYVAPKEMVTAEIGDDKGATIWFSEFTGCPITEKWIVDAHGNLVTTEKVDVPIALSSTNYEQVLDSFADNAVPMVKITPENHSLEPTYNMCTCYTICTYLCNEGDPMCHGLCGDSPNGMPGADALKKWLKQNQRKGSDDELVSCKSNTNNQFGPKKIVPLAMCSPNDDCSDQFGQGSKCDYTTCSCLPPPIKKPNKK